MTDTIARPAAPARRTRTGRQRSVVLAGVLSAAGAAGLGMLCCLSVVVLGWATDPNSTGTSAGLVRAAGQLWLLAHRAPIVVGDQSITLAPLGITFILLVFAARAAAAARRHSRARTTRQALGAALCVVPPYLLIVAVAAGATATDAARAAMGPAVACAALVVIIGLTAGVVRDIGWAELTHRWPAPIRAVSEATLAATATLVATGALLAAGSLVADASRVTAIAQSIEDAAAAGLALLVVQLALAPNAVIWASAYAAGPGFAVGVGTQIAPSGVVVGSVPGLPLLAALPASGEAPAAAALSLIGVLLAGGVAGALLGRRCRRTPHDAPVCMVAVAVVAAVGFGLLCWLAGGSGPGRLAVLGPRPVVTGAAVAQWLLLSGVPAAWLSQVVRDRRAHE